MCSCGFPGTCGPRVFASYQEFVGCRAFVDGRVVAWLSLGIAFPAGFLRIHRLYLGCENVVGGMLTAGDSSQGNLIVEV